MDMTLDILFREKMNENNLTPLTASSYMVIMGEQTFVVANRITNPPPASTSFTHGNNENPVFSDFTNMLKANKDTKTKKKDLLSFARMFGISEEGFK